MRNIAFRPRALMAGALIIMNFLQKICSAACIAAISSPVLAAQPADQQFEALARLPKAKLQTLAGEKIEVDVDLSTSSGFSIETVGERAEARYRMAFNQIAEGWSWRPQANPELDDYYQYKFLPLQSVVVERGVYEHEDKIGVPEQVKVEWRYDYFLAFDNLYDFYPRKVDDDAGFSADLSAADAANIGMRARARLIDPEISESNTFWKATYRKPVDFSLKKRYLIGKLEEITFYDKVSGKTFCRIGPGQARCSGR